MEWSDMSSHESHQDDWILEQQRENLDIENFMQKPSNFESFNNENDSDYYSTFPSTGSKQMFKVTFNSSSKPSSSTSSSSSSSASLSQSQSLLVKDEIIASSAEGMKQPSLSSMSISERMKYKKEKAKHFFEKKTKREDCPLNQPDATIPINEDDELINSSECNNTESNYQRAKRDSLLSVDNNNNSEKMLNKKEIKMLRNRASAQRSRDRRKKEFDELHLFTRNIQTENDQLKAEIARRDIEMELIKNKIMTLCSNCKNSFSFFNWESKCTDEERMRIVEHNIASPKGKYSLIAGLLVILCVIGTIAINSNANTAQTQLNQSNSNNRILQEKTLPFDIVKDYSRRKGREAEFLHKKRKEFIIKEYNANGMKINIIHDEEHHKDIDYSKQVPEEDIEMNNDKDNDKGNGNMKSSSSTQVVPLSFYEEKQYIKSLFCKDFITSNEKNNDLFKQLFQNTHPDSSNDKASNPTKDEFEYGNMSTLSKQLHLRHNFDLKQHIKDLPKVTADNKKDSASLDNESDETKTMPSSDLILHMIIPTGDQMEKRNDSKDASKAAIDNSFYEVGCKIFEINKYINNFN